jgi:hypothetical protein
MGVVSGAALGVTDLEASDGREREFAPRLW